VDVAFDLEVPETITADWFIERVQSHVQDEGLSIGIAGQDGVNTRYIGARESQRRIRVYRKDLQDTMWQGLYGPTLRVELQLRKDQARLWWMRWQRSTADGHALAAAHVAQMTGVQLLADLAAIPEAVQPEAADFAGELFQFLQQHGARVDAWMGAGVDLRRLASDRVSGLSRVSRWRHGQMVKRLAAVNVGAATALVASMLTRGPVVPI